MTKKTYRVRGIDLHHDGQRYPEGSTIELGDDEAAGKRRWLEPVALADPSKPPKGAKADDNKSADDKTPADGDAGKTDDKGQSTGQGEGDKQ